MDYPASEYLDLERPVAGELRHRLVELIETGHDVVLDHGLWRRSDRDAYKRLIEAHGASWRLLYLKADRELLLRRLADRRARDGANAMPSPRRTSTTSSPGSRNPPTRARSWSSLSPRDFATATGVSSGG